MSGPLTAQPRLSWSGAQTIVIPGLQQATAVQCVQGQLAAQFSLQGETQGAAPYGVLGAYGMLSCDAENVGNGTLTRLRHGFVVYNDDTESLFTVVDQALTFPVIQGRSFGWRLPTASTNTIRAQRIGAWLELTIATQTSDPVRLVWNSALVASDPIVALDARIPNSHPMMHALDRQILTFPNTFAPTVDHGARSPDVDPLTEDV